MAKAVEVEAANNARAEKSFWVLPVMGAAPCGIVAASLVR
jgi:hypothetical protein